MTYMPTQANGGLPTTSSGVGKATAEGYIAAALRGGYVCEKCGVLVANDDRHDEWHADDRHAELAAVESLERKVDALVRFELARIAPTVESSNEDVTKTLESAFVRQIGAVDD